MTRGAPSNSWLSVIRRTPQVLMLRDPTHQALMCDKTNAGLAITLDVADQLVRPSAGVRFGHSLVFLELMPGTAVHKHDDRTAAGSCRHNDTVERPRLNEPGVSTTGEREGCR